MTNAPTTTPSATTTETGTRTQTPTPTATSTSTVPPPPEGVRLNEILPAPRRVDWNGDGFVNERDEWIELYNGGPTSADIGGWYLENTRGAIRAYRIPRGTILQPNAYIVFYRGMTGINLNDRGERVLLLDGRRKVVDMVALAALGEDASTSRDLDGVWHTDWPPTPGGFNLPRTLIPVWVERPPSRGAMP